MAVVYNLEHVYMALFGASNSRGVKYDVIEKWFTRCKIIDGRIISGDFFARSYERLCPNREELSQAQFVQLIGILSRETRRSVDVFLDMFDTVRQVIVDEIIESRANDDYTKS